MIGAPLDISVIIPFHNSSTTIDRCLKSVIHQSSKVAKIIVVNDHSTHFSRSVLAEYGSLVEVANSPKRGPAAARNYGVSRAKTNMIAFLDADDAWAENKISKQLQFLEKTHQMMDQLVGTYATYKNSKDKTIGRSIDVKQGVNLNKWVMERRMMPFLLSTWLLPRSTFERLGGFNEEFLLASDYEFILRYAKAGFDIRCIGTELCDYYISNHSLTTQKYLNQFKYARFAEFAVLDSSHSSIDPQTVEEFKLSFTQKLSAISGALWRRGFTNENLIKRGVFYCLAFCCNPIRSISKILSQTDIFKNRNEASV